MEVRGFPFLDLSLGWCHTWSCGFEVYRVFGIIRDYCVVGLGYVLVMFTDLASFRAYGVCEKEGMIVTAFSFFQGWSRLAPR